MNGRHTRPESHLKVRTGPMTCPLSLNPGRKTKLAFFIVIVNVGEPSIKARWLPPESLLNYLTAIMAMP